MVWSGYRWLKVTGNVTIRQSAYNLLFISNRNFYSILYCFQGTVKNLWKFSDLTLPTPPVFSTHDGVDAIRISPKSLVSEN